MEFHRSYPKPIRLYRGTAYIISKSKAPEKYEPVIYDGDGFPVRWSPPIAPKAPMGFNAERIRNARQ